MNPPAPAISVVIPCRGREALLHRALGSVRAQTWTDWEAVVIDDASAAPLGPGVAGFGDPRLRVVRLPANLGPAGAREAGLAAARGRWAAYLDSDDVWRPEKLARQMARMAEGAPRVLVSGTEVAGPSGPRARPTRPSRPGERIGAFLYLANQFAQASGILAPMEAARAAGFGGLRQYEDHFHLIRLEALGWPVEVSSEALSRQSDDAADRLGARDDPARARAFLRAAGDMLTPAERAGFTLRCLGAGLDRRAALRLAVHEGGRGGVATAGAALRLGIRAMAGGARYEAWRAAAQRGLRGW